MIFLSLILFVLAAPVLLGLLLWPALQCVDGGRRAPGFLLAGVLGFVLDIIVARTTFVLLFGWPRWRELTVSHSLQRIVNEMKHPRLHWAVYISEGINEVGPNKKHIDLTAYYYGKAIHG